MGPKRTGLLSGRPERYESGASWPYERSEKGRTGWFGEVSSDRAVDVTGATRTGHFLHGARTQLHVTAGRVLFFSMVVVTHFLLEKSVLS